LKKIHFDPQTFFSKMPKRLPKKTKKEVLREFEKETYKKIYKRIKNKKNISLTEVERMQAAYAIKSPFVYLNNYYYGTGKEKLKKTLTIYAKTIKPHLKDASALVELGAGYGSKIFGLAELLKVRKIPLYAFELTRSGQKILEVLSSKLEKKLLSGFCDLRTGKLAKIKIPQNSIIFTSYALHYVPNGSLERVYNFLCDQDAKSIIHFEPCSIKHKKMTIQNKLCNKYLKINNYNSQILDFLQEKERNKQIDLKVQKNIFGSNPLLPFSIIEWRKRY